MATHDEQNTPETLTYNCQGEDITTTVLLPTSNRVINDKTHGNLSNIHGEFNERDEQSPWVSKGPPRYRSQRYTLAYILFGGVMINFFLRANLAIAIVCMVNHTATSPESSVFSNGSGIMVKERILNEQLRLDLNHLSQSTMNSSLKIKSMLLNDTEFDSKTKRASEVFNDRYAKETCLNLAPEQQTMEDGPLKWDKRMQGLLLGALFWTYMTVACPGNALIRNVSKKRVIAVTVSLMSGSTLLTPVAALWSPWAVFAIKLLHGGCSVLAMSTIFGMWTTWAPPKERTGLIAITFSGVFSALALVYPISGFLCRSKFLGGWPLVFYFFGLLGIIWTFIFVFFTSDKPASHPSITREERIYIESSLSLAVKEAIPPTPWLSVLRSIPVWGIICLQLSHAWNVFFLSLTLPQYMKEVLKFKIDSNGLFTMIPFLMMWILSAVFGHFIDWVVRKGTMSLIVVRKIGAIFANFVPATLLIVLSFLDCTYSTLAVVILSLAVGILGMNVVIFTPMPYDLAPQFAQSILTFTNSISSITGILAPYTVAIVTKDMTREQWQVVFFITSALMMTGAVAFCIMAKANIQNWALIEHEPSVRVSANLGEANGVNDTEK